MLWMILEAQEIIDDGESWVGAADVAWSGWLPLSFFVVLQVESLLVSSQCCRLPHRSSLIRKSSDEHRLQPPANRLAESSIGRA